MASVHKNKDCTHWFASFRGSNGKQYRRSTGETNRKQALKVAQHFEDIAKGRMSPRRMRQILAEFYREESGIAIPTATVRVYAEEWLKAKKAAIALNSQHSYTAAVRQFLAFLGEVADADILSITKQHLTGFRDCLAQRSAPVTVNSRLKAIKGIFHCAKRDGYLVDDPSEFVEGVRVSGKGRRDAFTIAELRAVLAVADPEWRSMILFGLYSGQRLGDICRLTWDNLDLETNVIRLIATKTNKTVVVPIAPPLRDHLDTLPVSDIPGAPLHPRAFEYYRNPKLITNVSNGFASLLAQAGLREPPVHRNTGKGHLGRKTVNRLTFHSLRHTAVSLLKDAGVPQATVQELVGHSSEAMSQHYTHVGLESLRRAADSFPRL
jgi:integrase